MTISNACGDLRERVSVLKLERTETGHTWQEERRVWANVQPDDRTNLFSKAGTGAPGADEKRSHAVVAGAACVRHGLPAYGAWASADQRRAGTDFPVYG